MAVNTQIDLAQSPPGNDATEVYFCKMEEPTSLIHSVDLQISMIINLSSMEANSNPSPQRHPRVVRLVCQTKLCSCWSHSWRIWISEDVQDTMRGISRQDKYRQKYESEEWGYCRNFSPQKWSELWEARPVGILVFTGSLLVKLNIK